MAGEPRAPIVVLAAVIRRGNAYLLARRLKGTHLADRWEFPGGKCEPNETHEACLARELREELDVTGTIGPEILTVEHSYPEVTVRLHFRSCEIDREPRPMLGQRLEWVARENLSRYDFPEADADLISLLMSRE